MSHWIPPVCLCIIQNVEISTNVNVDTRYSQFLMGTGFYGKIQNLVAVILSAFVTCSIKL